MLTASKTLREAHEAELRVEGQLLLTATDLAFDVAPQLLLSTWPERSAGLTAAHTVSTRRVVSRGGSLLSLIVKELTGFAPPPEDMVDDPEAYARRLAGMKDFPQFALTMPRRVRERQSTGWSLLDAVGIEQRTFRSIAIGDPFRTWRKLTEDATTAPTNPFWKGWARIPEPGACAFCRMLASRGAVYKRNTGNFHSHNRCRCTARAVADEGAREAIRAGGADAWAEMQASGDVPKIPRDKRRAGQQTRQRVTELTNRAAKLARAQERENEDAVFRRKNDLPKSPGASGRAAYRQQLLREYREERAAIYKATGGKPPR